MRKKLQNSLTDSQVIEVIGRNCLVNALLHDGIEVAFPVRDRGVDLVAYVETGTHFIACPIQIKVASFKAFSIDKKYKNIANLLLVYVWGLQDINHTEIYALSYSEALVLAETMGWTKTEKSWQPRNLEKGKYSTSKPSKQLCKLLHQYKMSGGWRDKVMLCLEGEKN